MIKLKSLFVGAILLTSTFFYINAEQNSDNREIAVFQTTHFYHQASLPTSLLIIDDDSVWEVLNPPMIKKLPDAEDPPFYFRLADWEKPMSVGVEYLLADGSNAPDYFPSNFIQEGNLGEFPYIITNLETNKFAYARPLATKEAIHYFVSYSKGEYESGYSGGWRAGFDAASGQDQ